MEQNILGSLIEQEKGPTESQAKDIALHKGSKTFEKDIEKIRAGINCGRLATLL
jgi:hypothetical protein